MILPVVTVLVVWFEALLVAAAGGSVLLPLLAAGTATLRMAVPFRLTIGERAWQGVLALFGATVLMAALLWPFPTGDGDPWHTTLACRFALCLLLLQVLVLLRRPISAGLPRFFPVLCLLTCVCVFHRTIDASQQTAYLLLAIAGVSGCAALFQAAALHEMPARAAGLATRATVVAVVFVGAAWGTWAAAGAWERGVIEFQASLPDWLATSESTYRPHSRSYARGGSLRGITVEKQNNPMAVALRVYCARTPGYLRGRVFDTFDGSRWRSASRPRRRRSRPAEGQVRLPLDQPPAGVRRPGRGKNLFAIDGRQEGPFLSMEIHNDPLRGEMVFAPLGTSYLLGEGRYLAADDHHVVYQGIDSSIPYTAYVSRSPRLQTLPDELRSRLLTPPPGLDSRVPNLAEEVCRRARTPRQKIDAVVGFLRGNFEYADKGVAFPPDVEPLSHFLLERPAAHCELFASSAVTLLRLEGVPCRYATGYTVTELDEYGDYWLARNRNAHAWAEAYDEQRQRWVLVEATPGMVVPIDDEAAEAGDAAAAADLTAAYSWLDDQLLGSPWGAFGGWLKYLLLCGVAALAALAAAYRLRRRFNRPQDAAGRRLATMQRLLDRVERRLRRRNLNRRPNETLHQFADRLRHTADDEWLVRCAEWYDHYARLRYSGEEFDVDRLSPSPL